jgi:hypothetical protein
VPIQHYYWDLKDAWVLCKQLGWTGVEAIKTNSYYGTRARYYKYGYFQCSGDEQSILNCQKSEDIDASYIQKYAAGVKCTKQHYGSNVTLQN